MTLEFLRRLARRLIAGGHHAAADKIACRSRPEVSTRNRADIAPKTLLRFPGSPFPIRRVPLLNNISVDGTGTKFYASPQLYVNAISAVMQTVRASQTGLAVLDEIHTAFPHRVTIKPYEGKELNAFSHANNEADAMPNGVSEGSGKDRIDGDGLGSDATITFTPGRYANDFTVTVATTTGPFGMKIPSRIKITRPPGALPEDVLLHEMTHTTRQLAGLMDNAPLGDGYDNEEEFYAILVANIFASEKGRSNDLRKNHNGHDPLVLNTDEKFLPKPIFECQAATLRAGSRQ